MNKPLINTSSLEAVKRQFVQDSVITFKGHVYGTDLNAITSVEQRMPIDKDGFPTPIYDLDDLEKLLHKMEEQRRTARSNYLKRMEDLETKMLATVKSEDRHERAE
jgi:hypothetical protein